MSGHSKWSTIKRKKGAADAKRGKVFSKAIREITVAARQGGSDPSANPRLRRAMDAAKAANMPSDNIERAIKKATGGDGEGAQFEEFTLEGYGPGGVALLLEVLTDNRNRSLAEIRHCLSKNNGSLGEPGCVAWIFEKKGVLRVSKDKHPNEDTLMESALEAGADDLKDEGEYWEILTDPGSFEQIRDKLTAASIESFESEISALPKNTVHLSGKDAEQMLKLVEALEDQDDTQHIYSNVDISDDEMQRISQLVA